MGVVELGIEQRPRQCGPQRRSDTLGRLVAVGLERGGRGVEIAGSGGRFDAAELQHHALQRRARALALGLAPGDSRVAVVGEQIDQLAQFVVDGVHRQRDHLGVVRRNGGAEHAREIADLLERNAEAVEQEGPVGVADRTQIGDEIALVLRREAEIEHLVEMPDHFLVALEAPIVEIRCVEIGIEQRRRLEEAARAHIVLPVIDEGRRWHVATGATQPRIVRERLVEQGLAAGLGRVVRMQPASEAETVVGEKVDVLDIGDERIEDARRRLRSRKLVDDDVAHEIAQRRHAPVIAVGPENAGAAQARDAHRIEGAVVGVGIEQ